MSNWVIIPDENVNNVWDCEECGDYAIVTPDQYQQVGTPVCADCDCDMTYSHTLIRSDEKGGE